MKRILALLAATKVVYSANLQQVLVATTATAGSPSSTAATRSGTHAAAAPSRGRGVGIGTLASAVRLSGEQVPAQISSTPSSFLRELRNRFTSSGGSTSSRESTSDDSSDGSTSSTIVVSTAPPTASSMTDTLTAVFLRVAKKFTNGLSQGGAHLRRTGWLAMLAVACLLSVSRASAVVSRPWGGRPSRSVAVVVADSSVAVDEENRMTSSSGSRAGRKYVKHARGGLLLKMPTFPLAHISWWKAVQDRRKVGGPRHNA